jgi:cyclopropane fatty-acyl-phospholipid synthase-like methyltransferase
MSKDIYIHGEYLKKNPTWHMEDSSWKAKQLLKIIERNHLKPTSICEVGCGAGEILNQLYLHMPKDITFTGYEISPQAFKLCQARTRDRLQFNLSDLLQDKEAFFDIVLAMDVLEHIEDFFGFLRNLREKGQYKIFHIPLDISVQSVLRNKLLTKREHSGHIHYFTKDTAMAVLKDTDYEIIDSFYTGSSIDTDILNKQFKSLLARLPRKLMFKLNEDLTVRMLGGYSLMILVK